MNFTIYERFAIINILSRIMEADNIIDPNEVAFMDKVLADLKITESDIAIINSYEFEQCQSIIKSMDAEHKRAAIDLFLSMAKCDGYADPRELEIIESLG
jgi:uncharacterized tellurite resistance protein B-like protein